MNGPTGTRIGGHLRRRWHRWVAAPLLVLGVFVGSPDPAGAAPEAPRAPELPEVPAVPAAPVAPAAPGAPADPADCEWKEMKQIVGEAGDLGVMTVQKLDCGSSNPRGVRREDLPELPDGCELVGSGGRGSVYSGECGTVPVAEYPGGHPCWWQETVDGDARSVSLKCPSNVYEPTVKDRMPELPTGCQWEQGNGGRGRERPECADVGMQEIDCRNERDLWFDDHKEMQVPAEAPQWWLDEIQEESDVDQGQGCKLAEHPPTLDCETRLRNARADGEEYESPGPMPDLCWGTYPTSNYELSWDDGSWTDVSKYGERVMGWVASFMFVITKTAIQIALWLVQWGFEFDISEYTDVTTAVAGRYDNEIVGPWGLDDIAWMALVGYAGYATLRRRFGVAGGEILLAFVLLGLATVLFDNRDVYMDAVSEAMTKGSDELLVAATGQDLPPDGANDQREQVIRPLQREIHYSFVEEPYFYLNWGRSDLPAACERVVQNIAATGWDGDGWPARYMGRAEGCEGELSEDEMDAIVSYNKEMNGERLGAAILTMVIGLCVAVTLGLASLTVLVAKVTVGVLFAVTPFVMVVAVLPGLGRRLAWRWAGTTVQAGAAAWGMAFIIALMLLAVHEFLDASRDLQLYERWGLVLLVIGVAYLGRKRVVAGTQTLATTMADAMTRLSPASAGWSGGNPVGVDFDRADRTLGTAARWGAAGAAATALVAGRSAQIRWQERRVARRGRDNLIYMERLRNRPQLEYRADTYAYGRRPGGGGQGRIDIRPNAPAPGPQGIRGRIAGAFGRGGRGGGQGGGFTGSYTPPPGGPYDGEMRERWEVVAKQQTPPNAFLHPFRHVGQRVANRSAMRLARREARNLRETAYAPDYFVEDRGHPNVKQRPRNPPRRPQPQGRQRWVPRAVRGRNLPQNVQRLRRPRGWQ